MFEQLQGIRKRWGVWPEIAVGALLLVLFLLDLVGRIDTARAIFDRQHPHWIVRALTGVRIPVGFNVAVGIVGILLLAWAIREARRFTALKRLIGEVEKDATAAKEAGALPSGLKLRALALADEILRFLEGRLAVEQPLPQLYVQQWWQRAGPRTPREHETSALYAQQFGERVAAVRDEFAGAHLHDSAWDAIYGPREGPPGVSEIHAVINGLRALAAKISDA
jgi:hypothetical protein